ncbi:hypothetical protein CVT26_004873 [Gymnopilus dilepis]|uniref:Nephrocystin 3-like N-terminal domain-containing protein n=1 Tax=Gymnopilus dilepis TaxID=231916 RepID=A0A409W8G8_9AGAR|nr:hypothetical protein CVT26_004873 [Gymnopilus dilepis]
MLPRNPLKRTHLASINTSPLDTVTDDFDEPVSKKRHVSPHIALSTTNTTGDTSDSNPAGSDGYFAGISSSIIGGRNNINYMLSGHAQINTLHTQPGIPESLRQVIVPSASHNSGARGDPPRCHPNTRVAVQEKIMNWIRGLDPETKDSAVMWLYGPAGSGKTAIAQSMAEALHELKMLLGSFFFGRLDSSRNHSGSLVATIAYQIALRLSGEVSDRIFSVVDRDPHVFQLSLKEQINLLLVEPLQPLVESGYFDHDHAARVVVIDGLDECVERGQQVDILQSISSSLLKWNLPIRFLIASRPEHDIKQAFGLNPLKAVSVQLALHDDYDANEDIELFLSDQFKEIMETHPFIWGIPPDWPTQSAIRTLVFKASGQFIYASTVVKYVKSIRHRPDERLKAVLDLHPSEHHADLPFAELDSLYTHVFSSVEQREKVFLFLSMSILSLRHEMDLDIPTMEDIFSLRRGEYRLLFQDLGSIVDLDSRFFLRFHHASVPDYLLDKMRSREFHIDAVEEHPRLACVLIHYLRRIEPELVHDKKPIQSNGIQSIIFLFRELLLTNPLKVLAYHIKHASPEAGSDLEREISEFDFTKFFQADFSSSWIHEIPYCLDCIKNSRLEKAAALYVLQHAKFVRYIRQRLEAYCLNPSLAFILALFHETEADYFLNRNSPRNCTLRLDIAPAEPHPDPSYDEIIDRLAREMFWHGEWAAPMLYILLEVLFDPFQDARAHVNDGQHQVALKSSVPRLALLRLQGHLKAVLRSRPESLVRLGRLVMLLHRGVVKGKEHMFNKIMNAIRRRSPVHSNTGQEGSRKHVRRGIVDRVCSK